MLILQQYFAWCGQAQVTVLQRRILYRIKKYKNKTSRHGTQLISYLCKWVQLTIALCLISTTLSQESEDR